jgi:hypothetical protein
MKDCVCGGDLMLLQCCVSYRSPGRSSVDDAGERDEKFSKAVSFTQESVSRASETEPLDGNSPKRVSIRCSSKPAPDTEGC